MLDALLEDHRSGDQAQGLGFRGLGFRGFGFRAHKDLSRVWGYCDYLKSIGGE